MIVDSFKYLPRLIATLYKSTEREPAYPIPWTSLPKPLADCTVALVTSAGLYQKGVDAPFDLAREQAEPTWGDPSYRIIPADISQAELGAAHLHINTSFVEADMNCLLPIQPLQMLAEAGHIGQVANRHYSFMGFQGFPPDTTAWEQSYGPQVSAQLQQEQVDCVLLTPA